jgi:polysaccharide pyruvyl transferase WcaK-like protein
VYNIWQPNLNHNISEFIEGLLNYDIIISSRYHGIVFSAVQGIPSIAIEIEPKLKIAAQTLQPGCLLWKQPFDATELLSHITTILNDYQARTDAILLSVEIQKHLGKLMLEEIEQFAFQNCNDLD